MELPLSPSVAVAMTSRRPRRDDRALSGLVRPLPQRTPGARRDRLVPLRRGDHRRDAKSAEGRAAVLARGPPVDDRRLARASRKHPRGELRQARGRRGQGARRRLHHQGRPRADRFRERDGASADQPLRVGRAHRVPAVGLGQRRDRVEVHPRHRALRRRRVLDGPRSCRQEDPLEIPAAMTMYDDEHARVAEATPAGSTVPPERSNGPGASYQHPESEALLRRVSEMIAGARPMPLSASVMINKDEVLEMLDEALERLPDELRAARWLLKERDEYLAKTRRDADDILDAARARAERMVQRTEVVKAAELRARHTVDAADEEARRLRLECEDYCDQKLASFEIVLERTMKTVSAGRTKLQGNPLSGEVPVVTPDEDEESAQAFFDQDQS